jgi:hypothetical protein
VLRNSVRREGASPETTNRCRPSLLVVGFVGRGHRVGDPMSSLRWTLKSTRVLAAELARIWITRSDELGRRFVPLHWSAVAGQRQGH